MKIALTILLLSATGHLSFAQYIPASVYETSLAVADPVPGIYNVGIDSRSAEVDDIYANITTAMVSDYRFGGTPRFFWDRSGMPGTYSLPSGILDPDVTLIEGINNNAWAIIVYYSPGMGGYCISFSQVIPGGMSAPSSPVLIGTYTYSSTSPAPYINIDADDKGHYAVVYQTDAGVRCGTGTMGAGFTPPPLPSNFTNYPGLIEPDVAVNFMSAAPSGTVKIIALVENRDEYVIQGRGLGGTPGFYYTSMPAPQELHRPRIACTPLESPDFAYVIKQKTTSGLHNILLGGYNATEGYSTPVIVNNGVYPTFPPAINSYENIFPSITYTFNENERISIGWYTAFLPGPPYSAVNTMVGIDLKPDYLTSLTPGEYLDISTGNADYLSTLGLSGRYVLWGAKTALFAFANSYTTPAKLVWKTHNSGPAAWRLTDESASVTTGVKLSPNPASTQVSLTIPNKEKQHYEVYNSLGLLIMKGDAAGTTKINIQYWPVGNYFFRVTDPVSRKTENKLFVKL